MRYKPAITTCDRCGAIMTFVLGPNTNCKVSTYTSECYREVETRRDQPNTIYPQRCGNICFKHVPGWPK